MISRFFKQKKSAQHDIIILVGAGEVGAHLARRLTQEGRQVVIVDVDAERLKTVRDMVDARVVHGSGSSPGTLTEAGIANAGFFLAVTDNDEINLVACMFANLLAPRAVKLARIRNPEYARYPHVFGAGALDIQMMVNVDEEVVRTVDRLLSLPGALDYAEFAGGGIRMVKYKIEGGILVGQPLASFRELLGDDGVMVGAIVRDERLIIPGGKQMLIEGDIAYFVHRAASQNNLLAALGRSRGTVRSVCIIGGGNIGTRLALQFERRGLAVKLIESDAARCEELADILKTTMILRGDGTDKALLEEANVGAMDALAAVSGDEESNILACLLAKSLGVRDTVAKIDKAAYLPLLEHVGIDHSVSGRLAAVNRMLAYIRGSRVVASATLAGQAGEEAEMLEVLLPGDSPLIGKQIRDIGFPRDLLMLAVRRGQGEAEEAFIPNGGTVLAAGDHLVLLGTLQAVARLEPRLASPSAE